MSATKRRRRGMHPGLVLPSPAAESNNEDGEIEVWQNDDNNKYKCKCPLTGTWMEDPVKNKACGHTYSREGIMAHIRAKKNVNTTMCPWPGCDKAVLQKDLESDMTMARLVKRLKRQAAADDDSEKEEEDDDDDDGNAAVKDIELVSPKTWERIPELLYVDMQKGSAEEVAQALTHLLDFLQLEDDAKEAFQYGGHAIVILLMKKFQYDEDIQANGCECLSWLAYHLDESSHSIAGLGGTEVLVNALKIFPNSNKLQTRGMDALSNLFGDLNNASDVVQKASIRFIKDLGGLGLSVAAMKKFHDKALLVQKCCQLLVNLAEKDEFRGPLKAVGAVGAVGVAFDKHYDSNYAIKRFATKFMKLMMP